MLDTSSKRSRNIRMTFPEYSVLIIRHIILGEGGLTYLEHIIPCAETSRNSISRCRLVSDWTGSAEIYEEGRTIPRMILSRIPRSDSQEIVSPTLPILHRRSGTKGLSSCLLHSFFKKGRSALQFSTVQYSFIARWR